MKPTAPPSSDRGPWPAQNSTMRRLVTLRILPTAALVLLLGGLVAAGRALPAEGRAPRAAARALPVEVATPLAVDGYERVREFTGEVRARRQVDIGFEVAGRVLEIAVDEGDRVETGALLARVDTRRLAAERLRLLAAKREAQAVLAEMRAGPRPEVLDAARTAVGDLEAQVDLLGRKAARRAKLLAQATISDEEYDEIRSLASSLDARLAGARARLRELENGTRRETLDAQVARAEGLDAQIARLDLDLEDGLLRAPFSARVLRRHADEGAVAGPGAPVLTLVEDRVLEAWVGVPPDVALRLPVSSPHVVRIGRHAFEATLEARLPATDAATRTQTLVLGLPPSAVDQVVPGQVARLEVSERVETDGYWLPSSALTRGVRGLWAVYALEATDDPVGWRAVRHAVEVLYTEQGRALVRGTLDASTQVVIGNAEKIAPGQAVRPSAPDA